jgi:UDPglucose 6-dehydrogenase
MKGAMTLTSISASVGIVGLGTVGSALRTAFDACGIEIRGYDRYLEIGSPQEMATASVVFVCVATPGMVGGGYDLSQVWSALEEIEPHMQAGSVIAVKSTVSPGTNDQLASAFPRVELASIPEFLVEARPIQTLTRPDRVVIGARSPAAAAVLGETMAILAPGAPQLVVRPIEAELIKLSSNAMLAAKVALANELAEVCRAFGVEWTRVQAGVGMDRRIGPEHLTVTPERGFAGSCLPKDFDALIAAASGAGHRPRVLEAIAEFNTSIRMANGYEPAAVGRATDGALG